MITPDSFDSEEVATLGGIITRHEAVDDAAGVGVVLIKDVLTMHVSRDVPGVDVSLAVQLTPATLRHLADLMEGGAS